MPYAMIWETIPSGSCDLMDLWGDIDERLALKERLQCIWFGKSHLEQEKSHLDTPDILGITLWYFNIAIENHHAVNGKSHYFYGHFQ